MSLAPAFCLVASALGLYVAALAWRFGLAPGFRDQRWFAAAALSGSLFTACNVVTMSSAPHPWILLFTALQLALGAAQVAAWHRYADAHLRDGEVGRRIAPWLVALGAGALVPGLALTGHVVERLYPPLGATYHDCDPTAYGMALQVAMVAGIAALIVRYLRARRHRAPQSALHVAAFSVIVVMAANDALATAGVLPTPYLLDLGFLIPMAVVGYGITVRFAAQARSLAELRGELERMVDCRTRELGEAREALHRAEKLAALGQFASGVAHEVNNPAAVVVANLRYLAEPLAASGAVPADGDACVAESQAAMDRIARIVRQLRDAGRLAAAPVPDEGVALAPVVAGAVAACRARVGRRGEMEVAVDAGLRVLVQETLLAELVLNLVSNAAQAIPPERRDGRVEVRARTLDGRVRLTVADNGAGMTDDVLAHVFEPFFSTKSFGEGVGLGLGVSRGLVQSLGGDLRIESAPGEGTRAVVDLPQARA